MTPSYLFHSEGLAALARYVTPDTLFAFDLNGTLAPIVEEPAAARIAQPLRATLLRLVELAKVAVISGRSRKDAEAMLGFEPSLVIGNHGAEWPPRNRSRNWQFIRLCLKWRAQLREVLGEAPGVAIEFKGESITLHYRKAPDARQALSLIHAAVDALQPAPKRVDGKLAVNLLPREALGKGDALAAAMQRLGATRAVYFGDDETDEEVFRLRRDEVFGVHVGCGHRTAAAYYLNQPSEMLGLLNSMVGILDSPREDRSAPERAASGA